MNFKLKAKYKGIVFFGNDSESIKRSIIAKFPDAVEYIDKINVIKNLQKISEPTPQKVVKKSISFKDGVSGANALFKVFTGSVVDQNEINRRSNICIKCPKVIGSTNCVACGFSKSLSKYIQSLKKAFGKGFVIQHGLESKHCSVCECALSVMIPSKLSAFKHDKDKQSLRPDLCWLKKGSPNYLSED